MAYSGRRALAGTLAAALLSLGSPASADSTTSTHCYYKHSRASGNYSDCYTDVKVKEPEPPPKPKPPPVPYAPPTTQNNANGTGVAVVRGGAR